MFFVLAVFDVLKCILTWEMPDMPGRGLFGIDISCRPLCSAQLCPLWLLFDPFCLKRMDLGANAVNLSSRFSTTSDECIIHILNYVSIAESCVLSSVSRQINRCARLMLMRLYVLDYQRLDRNLKLWGRHALWWSAMKYCSNVKVIACRSPPHSVSLFAFPWNDTLKLDEVGRRMVFRVL